MTFTYPESNKDLSKAINRAISGRQDDAVSIVEQIYREDSHIRDAFAIIGNVYCLDGDYDTALKLMARDGACGRISPPYRHVYAYLLSKDKKSKEAIFELNRACDEDPSLRYGYLLIDPLTGKERFSIGDYDDDFISVADSIKDNGNDLLFRSRCLAQRGRWDEAELHVKKAYDADVNLRDGLAHIGNILLSFVRYEKALYYYKADKSLNRLTPAGQLILGKLLASKQQEKEANEQILSAYGKDNSLRDGFSMIGAVCRNTQRYDDALTYYERDKALNRLSPAQLHIFADQQARIGMLDEAQRSVETGYADEPSLRNGYARIGNILRVKGDYRKALDYYERDWRRNRLSPAHQLIYAEILSRTGHFNESIRIVKTAYAEDPSITDGYSRCAWYHFFQKKKYSKIILFCELDRIRGRLSPNWAINYAQVIAKKGDLKKARELVQDAYKMDPGLTSGYARCVWQHYWPKKEYRQIIEQIESEKKDGRLSPEWELNLSQAYAAIGEYETAMRGVDEAYKKKNTLNDGRARCAWQYFWPRREYDHVIEQLEKEKTDGRLSPEWELNLSQAYAAIGEYETAMRGVDEAYKKKNTLNDGHARCAWQYFWPRREYDHVIEQLEKEKTDGRLSPEWELNLSQAYAAIGEYETAMRGVDEAYKKKNTLNDGRARCAWQYFWPRREYGHVIEQLEKEKTDGRLSPEWELKLAQAYAAIGNMDRALTNVRNAYEKSPLLIDGYCNCAWQRYWIDNNYKGFMVLCEKDKQSDRMSPKWDLYLGLAYAHEKEVKSAAELLNKSSWATPVKTFMENGRSKWANKELHLGLYIGHDPGVCLVDDDGIPLAFYEESKFCGRKTTYFHPNLVLNELRKQGLKKLKTLSWALPESVQSGWYHHAFYTHLQKVRIGLTAYLSTFLTWESEFFLAHHRAHAETAFFPSPFDQALCCIIDGSGENESFSVFECDRYAEEPLILKESYNTEQFSFGHTYDAFTRYLGYRTGRGAEHCGKIMGLSSYGKPLYVDKLKDAFCCGSNMFPRDPKEGIVRLLNQFGTPFKRPTINDDQEQINVAASVQRFTEEVILDILRGVKKRYPRKSRNLCIAGGVAMNSLVNGKIIKSGLFSDIYIQPASSDNGLPLGAALFGCHKWRRLPPKTRWTTAYWGYNHESNTDELDEILNKYNFPVKIQYEKIDAALLAEIVIEGNIVGLFQGAQEIGARALGNRSIITLPTAVQRDKINSKVKFREPWRPFAPIVKEDSVGKYFCNTRPEPFMTVIYDVEKKYHNSLDGITHVDGTARVQTVNRKQNRLIYDLLDAIEKRGLPPVILNTSFNIMGQPIVRTVYDAINTFCCCGIDELFIDGRCLAKTIEKELPSKNIDPVDRSVEPFLRHCNTLDIFLGAVNKGVMKQLKEITNIPAIIYRQKPIKLRQLSYKNISLTHELELKAEYGNLFDKISSSPVSSTPSENHCMLVITGSQLSMDTLASGIEEDEFGLQLPKLNDIIGLHEVFQKIPLNDIMVIDNKMHTVQGAYFTGVVTPVASAS